MRHTEQVHLRRELVCRVPPVAVREYAQLPALDECRDPLLDVGEVLRRALRPPGDALGDFGCLLRVGFQCAHDVHPVERVQVVEVDHVILKVLRAEHEVPHELGVRGDGDPQRVFHRPYGRQGMHRCADPAGPLREGPCVPGVTPLEYPLEPPDHRPGAERVDNLAVPDFYFNAEVSLDTRDRVDDDAVGHQAPPFFESPDGSLSLISCWMSFRFLILVETAWTAIPAAVATPRTTPTLSAVVSIPNPGKDARCW